MHNLFKLPQLSTVKMVKVILFDFWGTLVDNGTYSPLRQSYAILRPRMEFSEFVQIFEKTIMTRKFDEQAKGFEAICDALGLPSKPFIIDKLIGLWNKNRLLAKLYPETMDVIAALKKKKYKLAIVSNTDSLIQQVIERLELDKYFDEMFLSYETELLKTEKELMEIILKKMKAKKEDVVMVGDSVETDMVCAENAGIKGILVDRKGTREYKIKIKDLTELENALE